MARLMYLAEQRREQQLRPAPRPGAGPEVGVPHRGGAERRGGSGVRMSCASKGEAMGFGTQGAPKHGLLPTKTWSQNVADLPSFVASWQQEDTKAEVNRPTWAGKATNLFRT